MPKKERCPFCLEFDILITRKGEKMCASCKEFFDEKEGLQEYYEEKYYKYLEGEEE